MDFITEILAGIDALKAGNVVGVGALMTALIKAYRMIPNAPWPREGWGWLVALVTFVIGFLVAMFTGVFGFGLGWGPSVMAALGVAINASGFYNVGKAVNPLRSQYNKNPASITLPPPK